MIGFVKTEHRLRTWTTFSVIIIFTLLIYGFYGLNIIRWSDSPDFGWRTMYDTGPNFVAEVFERGTEAGLHVGDEIIAINGKPYSTFDELFFSTRNAGLGSVNRYTVKRGDWIYREQADSGGQGDLYSGELEPSQENLKTSTHVTRGIPVVENIDIETGRLGFWTVLSRSAPLYAIGFVYVLIGSMVFIMKPDSKESLIFLLMMSVMGPVISFAAPSDLMKPSWLFDVRTLYSVLFPVPIINLALRFPKKRKFLNQLPNLWIITLMGSGLLFIAMKFTSTAYWNIPPVLDRLNVFYILLAVIFFVLTMAWNALIDKSHLVKAQSKMILLGMSLGLMLPTTELLARSVLNTYIFPKPAIGFALFLALFPVSIGYTIIRHDLFAIDRIIKRAYGYVITTIVVAALYGFMITGLRFAFGDAEFMRTHIFQILFILAVTVLFNPLKDKVQRLVDRLFFRLDYDYRTKAKEISEALRSLMPLCEIGKYMVATARSTLFVDLGSVYVMTKSGEAYEFLTAEGEIEIHHRFDKRNEFNDGSHEELEFKTIDKSKPVIQILERTRKELTLYDLESDVLSYEDKVACKTVFSRLAATLLVPLIYENNVTGFLALGRKRSGKFYRPEDISLLSLMASQGAVTIQNAQMVADVLEKGRMEEELSIARELQSRMFPPECPSLPGFTIASFCQPAREVGGDFFDFINASKGKTGIVVGDVTGKSVSGALVMSATRSIFRTLSDENLSVPELMCKANARIKLDVIPGMFVALLYAQLDTHSKTFELCSAGQTQPIYIPANGEAASYVDTIGDNFPLGILDEVDYGVTKIIMNQGDLVIFFTDGVVEAMNPSGEMFGFERMLEVATHARNFNAESCMLHLRKEIAEFVGNAEQHDDITLIAIKYEN